MCTAQPDDACGVYRVAVDMHVAVCVAVDVRVAATCVLHSPTTLNRKHESRQAYECDTTHLHVRHDSLSIYIRDLTHVGFTPTSAPSILFTHTHILTEHLKSTLTLSPSNFFSHTHITLQET